MSTQLGWHAWKHQTRKIEKTYPVRIAIRTGYVILVKIYCLVLSNIKSLASSIGRGPSPYQAAWILTSFWTGRITKDHRTHTVNSVLKNAHFLVAPPRAPWHDTCRVTRYGMPAALFPRGRTRLPLYMYSYPRRKAENRITQKCRTWYYRSVSSLYAWLYMYTVRVLVSG
jgi:hypothetical protein